jgi:hypothetical protein
MKAVGYIFGQIHLTLWLYALTAFSCAAVPDVTPPDAEFRLRSIEINGVSDQESYTVDPIGIVVRLTFSEKVATSDLSENITLVHSTGRVPITVTYANNPVLEIHVAELLSQTTYELIIGAGLTSEGGTKIFTGRVFRLTTTLDITDKFSRISDDDLLTLVQRQTFRYFWDFGHPISGMAPERNATSNTVTTGGTGFGIMSILVAAERGFVTRDEALDRIQKIVTFLSNSCTRYHGAFSHWVNGTTGETVAFSPNDNGGDLVETSFLMQGLLAACQYFGKNDGSLSQQEILKQVQDDNRNKGRGGDLNGSQDDPETTLRNDIIRLWEDVEWSWYRRDNEDVLYWHWSPDKSWVMNHQIRGWNECLITYVLAAASPTYPIPASTYHKGWAESGGIVSGKSFYGYVLPLGEDYGGPLFFSHYSHLGLDPRGLRDAYADYWLQAVSHALINRRYCMENPEGYVGYGEDCWGLTASDNRGGYSAHSPGNDLGVISPTGAISSIPYSPDHSLDALRYFYYKLGDRLWGEYGFKDAFNLSENWYADSYLAIDEGPIVVMIENYRTQLLWNLFMSHPDVLRGLKNLGFSSPHMK